MAVASGRRALLKAECRRLGVLPSRTFAFDLATRRQGAQDYFCLVNKVAWRRVDPQRRVIRDTVGFEEQLDVVAHIATLRNIHRAAQQWDEKLAVENKLLMHLVSKDIHRGGVTVRRRRLDYQFGEDALEPDVRMERREREVLPLGATPCGQEHALARQDVEHRPVAKFAEQLQLALGGGARPKATDQHDDAVQLAVDERAAVHEIY